ncbi:MAG: hypothetical protein N4A72_22695 [Bacteroidales bacterium]|jgi:hypothetical protein|nr:hypothetical protein [Bacteroidales bacterium]
MKNNNCKLCSCKNTCDSHVIPKFIFKWIKKTGTGRLRSIENINLPVQDGIVEQLLCRDCEEKFNKSETFFAKKIFYPFLENKIEFIEYDNNFQYFLVSVFWRLLKNCLDKDIENTKWVPLFKEIENHWANYLLNKKSLNKFNNFHCLAGVDVIDCDDSHDSNDFVMYMSRSVDAGIPNNDNACFFFLKIPRFIFILPIIGFSENSFENTKILEEGVLNFTKGVIKDDRIGNYLFDRSVLFRNRLESMSQNQKEITRKLTADRKNYFSDIDLGQILKYINH